MKSPGGKGGAGRGTKGGAKAGKSAGAGSIKAQGGQRQMYVQH